MQGLVKKYLIWIVGRCGQQ